MVTPPLLLTQLVGAMTRQLTHLSRHRLLCQYPPSAALCRPLSTLTSAPSRGFLTPRAPTALQSPSPDSAAQGTSSLLGRCQQNLPCLLQPSAGMKTKSALKKRCADCFFVVRRGRLFVICKTHGRHKQRQC